MVGDTRPYIAEWGRRKPDYCELAYALLGYILKRGFGQFQTVIFLNRWLASQPPNEALSRTW